MSEYLQQKPMTQRKRVDRGNEILSHTLPVPGGPHNIKLGIFPSMAMARNRTKVSSFPTTSSRVRGRYFSTHGISYPPVPLLPGGLVAVDVVVVEVVALRLDPLVVDVSSVDMVHARRGDLNLEEFIMSSNTLS